MAVALLAPLAWLLGTFPSATLVARAKGRDILHEGSGNPGASNVARLLGWKYGLLVLVMDFAKGLVAAGAGLAVGGRPGAYVLGIAAVVGHTFPLYRKGGKGVACAGGMLVVLFPLIVLGLAGRLVGRRRRARQGFARVVDHRGALPGRRRVDGLRVVGSCRARRARGPRDRATRRQHPQAAPARRDGSATRFRRLRCTRCVRP